MPAPTVNGTSGTGPQVNGTGVNVSSANDNIRRFGAPSRPLTPPADHTLFHTKTRCFV